MARSWGFKATVAIVLIFYSLVSNISRVQAVTGLVNGVTPKVINSNYLLDRRAPRQL